MPIIEKRSLSLCLGLYKGLWRRHDRRVLLEHADRAAVGQRDNGKLAFEEEGVPPWRPWRRRRRPWRRRPTLRVRCGRRLPPCRRDRWPSGRFGSTSLERWRRAMCCSVGEALQRGPRHHIVRAESAPRLVCRLEVRALLLTLREEAPDRFAATLHDRQQVCGARRGGDRRRRSGRSGPRIGERRRLPLWS